MQRGAAHVRACIRFTTYKGHNNKAKRKLPKTYIPVDAYMHCLKSTSTNHKLSQMSDTINVFSM